MVNLKKLKSNKKQLVLIISVLIIFVSVIALLILTFVPELKHSYTIEPLALESEDNIYISAFKYTPKGQKSHAGIVVGHSFLGNKLNMQPLSIELVKRGFTVINIDFRGHGASGGSFLRGEVIKDMKAAVDYLEDHLSYISEIGLVGHSLGAEAALTLSFANPERINATVAIGLTIYDVKAVSNLLVASGQFDTGLSEIRILKTLRRYTGQQNVKIGQLYYGDFIGGNNIKGYISPFSDHLSEIIDFNIIYQTVQWFEQSFNGKMGRDVLITANILQAFSYIALFGVIMLNAVLIAYISHFLFKNRNFKPEKEILQEFGNVSYKKFLLNYAIHVVFIQLIFFLFISDISTGIIAFSTTSITLSLIIGAAIGIVVVYNFLLLNWKEYFSIKDFFLKIKLMCSKNSGRSIFFGILVGLQVILSIAAIWHWSVQNSLPTLEGVGRMILIILISFPFFLIKEFYYRNVQGSLNILNRYEEYIVMVGIGIFMDNLLIFFVIAIGWMNLAYIPAYVLYLLGWIIFSIIQHCLVTYVYMHSGRNILGSTIFISIFYSWMLVVFFPSYGFL